MKASDYRRWLIKQGQMRRTEFSVHNFNMLVQRHQMHYSIAKMARLQGLEEDMIQGALKRMRRHLADKLRETVIAEVKGV